MSNKQPSSACRTNDGFGSEPMPSLGSAGLDLPDFPIRCDKCNKPLTRRSPDEPVSCRVIGGKRVCVRCQKGQRERAKDLMNEFMEGALQ